MKKMLIGLVMLAACAGDDGSNDPDAGPSPDAGTGAEPYFGTYRATWTCANSGGACRSSSWIPTYDTGIEIKYPASVVWGERARHPGTYDGACFLYPPTTEGAGLGLVHVSDYVLCPVSATALEGMIVARRDASFEGCACSVTLTR